MPHLGLNVNIGFFILFSLLFLSHLLIEENSHLFLISFDSFYAFLFHVSLILFSFLFISRNHFIFPLLLCIHLINNVISHFVHEFLCSCFSWFHFIFLISFLFIEHFGIFFLSSQVIESLSFVVFLLSLFIHFIFMKHLLKIVTLLLSLFHLHSFFGFHFTLEPINIFMFLVLLIFFFSSPSSSFFPQLLITCIFIGLYFHHMQIVLFSFSLI